MGDKTGALNNNLRHLMSTVSIDTRFNCGLRHAWWVQLKKESECRYCRCKINAGDLVITKRTKSKSTNINSRTDMCSTCSNKVLEEVRSIRDRELNDMYSREIYVDEYKDIYR